MKPFFTFLKEHLFLVEELDRHAMNAWSLFGYKPEQRSDKKLQGHWNHVHTALRVARSLFGPEKIEKQLTEMGSSSGKVNKITFTGPDHTITIGHPSSKAKLSKDLTISHRNGQSFSIDIGSGEKIVGSSQRGDWDRSLGKEKMFSLTRPASKRVTFKATRQKSSLPVGRLSGEARNLLHRHINDTHSEDMVLTPAGHIFSARSSEDEQGNHASVHSFRGAPLRTIGDNVVRARHESRKRRPGISLYMNTASSDQPNPDLNIDNSDDVREFVSSMLEQNK
jgi:hypothetical protein